MKKTKLPLDPAAGIFRHGCGSDNLDKMKTYPAARSSEVNPLASLSEDWILDRAIGTGVDDPTSSATVG